MDITSRAHTSFHGFCSACSHVLTTTLIGQHYVSVCENDNCMSEKLEFTTVAREDAQISDEDLLRAGLPGTLRYEPAAKYRYLDSLVWLQLFRRNNVYDLLCVEAMTLNLLLKSIPENDVEYTPSLFAKKLLSLTPEEIQAGKHVIPDLVKMIVILRRFHDSYLHQKALRSTSRS